MDGEFSERTKKIIAKRAGEKCSICATSTSKPNFNDFSNFINLGEAAHIRGNKQGRHYRFDNSMTDKERSDISNAIWLCKSCHKQIDSDSIKYTVPILQEIKRRHENKVYLGEFDIVWKEHVQLEKRIIDLEKLINEKEKSQTFQESVINFELNVTRIV